MIATMATDRQLMDNVGEVAMGSRHTYCLSFTGHEETWASELEGSHLENWLNVMILTMNPAARGKI